MASKIKRQINKTKPAIRDLIIEVKNDVKSIIKRVDCLENKFDYLKNELENAKNKINVIIEINNLKTK